MIIYLDTLLNAPKPQNVNDEIINIQKQSVQPQYVGSDESFDDRHERTGSVKFADQSEAGKEVF